MNILLDTHVLLWAITGSRKLTAKAKKLISDPGNTIYVSIISPWEVEIKHNRFPDRMLICQAKAEDMILITCDENAGRYKEKCICKI